MVHRVSGTVGSCIYRLSRCGHRLVVKRVLEIGVSLVFAFPSRGCFCDSAAKQPSDQAGQCRRWCGDQCGLQHATRCRLFLWLHNYTCSQKSGLFKLDGANLLQLHLGQLSRYRTKGFLTAFFACSAVLFFLGAFLSSSAAAFTCRRTQGMAEPSCRPPGVIQQLESPIIDKISMVGTNSTIASSLRSTLNTTSFRRGHSPLSTWHQN